jgi:hypothetical protein
MRRARTRWLVCLVLPLMLAIPSSGTVAQDDVGDAFCTLLTTKEVRDVLATKVESSVGPSGCVWSATKTDQFTAVSAEWSGLSIAEQKEMWPDGSDVTIGGHTAYYSPGDFLNELLIELDGGVLHLALTGYDGDVQAALTQLGELAVPRSGSLPPPAQAGPVPSMDADPALEALFPATIGGEPVDVQSVAGEEAIFDPEDRTSVGQALAGIGKSFDDLTAAFAFASSGAVAAYKVSGADGSALLPLIVGSMAGPDVELTPAEVGGKDVTLVGADSPFYAYPAGEVLWLVQAEEPGLSEILAALP